MGVRKTAQAAAVGDFVEIGPEIAERMTLEREPSGTTVASYVLTRGASRAWEAINNQLSGAQGALFWIGGGAGAGKTHFLNYVGAEFARRRSQFRNCAISYATD
jgi:chromosomal replication initiation ATPase DnaA